MVVISKSESGRLAEDFAAEYLIRCGYKMIERNYRSKRGEIDIIAFKDGLYAIFEVRKKRSVQYGSAIESISRSKINRIRMTSKLWLKNNGINENKLSGIKAFLIDRDAKTGKNIVNIVEIGV